MMLPLGRNDDVFSIVVQMVAPYGDEATLFRLASQIEPARPWFDRKLSGWRDWRSKSGGFLGQSSRFPVGRQMLWTGLARIGPQWGESAENRSFVRCDNPQGLPGMRQDTSYYIDSKKFGIRHQSAPLQQFLAAKKKFSEGLAF